MIMKKFSRQLDLLITKPPQIQTNIQSPFQSYSEKVCQSIYQHLYNYGITDLYRMLAMERISESVKGHFIS